MLLCYLDIEKPPIQVKLGRPFPNARITILYHGQDLF